MDYKELIVWQKSIDMAAEAYQLRRKLPSEEKFAMVSQIQRAAASVPANIAEGYGRGAPRELSHFLSIAMGSLKEVESHIILCVRIGYLSEADVTNVMHQIEEVAKMLYSLKKHCTNEKGREVKEEI